MASSAAMRAHCLREQFVVPESTMVSIFSLLVATALNIMP
jgi:hypothetical protein